MLGTRTTATTTANSLTLANDWRRSTIMIDEIPSWVPVPGVLPSAGATAITSAFARPTPSAQVTPSRNCRHAMNRAGISTNTAVQHVGRDGLDVVPMRFHGLGVIRPTKVVRDRAPKGDEPSTRIPHSRFRYFGHKHGRVENRRLLRRLRLN